MQRPVPALLRSEFSATFSSDGHQATLESTELSSCFTEPRFTRGLRFASGRVSPQAVVTAELAAKRARLGARSSRGPPRNHSRHSRKLPVSVRRAAMASSSFTRCPNEATPTLVRQARENRFVYVILAEDRLILPEAQAPQPNHDVHDGGLSPTAAHDRPKKKGVSSARLLRPNPLPGLRQFLLVGQWSCREADCRPHTSCACGLLSPDDLLDAQVGNEPHDRDQHIESH
jgi:hypothetical protein